MSIDSSPQWLPAPFSLQLGANEVHLWRASLDCDPAVRSRLEGALAPDELARADRFFSQIDRNHFVVARGILRELLGGYLRFAPSKIQFCYGDNGKPALREETHGSFLQFNLSHSGGLAVYAFSFGRKLGVDVEIVRPQSAADEIAERYFAPGELAELRKLPQTLKAEGFFSCWTRKEAYVKAHGAGLSIPLDSFTVSLTPGGPVDLDSTDSAEWSINSFKPSEGYIAAIVAEGKTCIFRYLEKATSVGEPCSRYYNELPML